ncbi:hypothetical protein HYS94_04640 [Candidatus Daviesbacteria bacterium]|nr:hypothetical protein [Candidatus Daviesbacteria bacterium]
MAERVFERPALSETPRHWRLLGFIRPWRGMVINTYDAVLGRLLDHGESLDQRFRAGEQLSDQELMTFVDAGAAAHGRHNVNAAEAFSRIRRQEARGVRPSPLQEELKENYQTGKFQLIDGTNQPFDENISVDRFTYPVEDEDQSFAIKDGAPVEGMIQLIDEEIQAESARTNLSLLNRIRRILHLRQLRSQRNILFTASSQAFTNENSVFHARTQLEAYHDYLDPIRSGGQLPDWFNAERFLRGRRVLNIPKRLSLEGWTIGLLPLPFVVTTLVPFYLLLTQPTHPCDGTDGQIYLEVFNESDPNKISVTGATERQMAYHRLGLSQRQYRSADDPELTAEVARLRSEEPDYYDYYLKVADIDYTQTGQRLRGDKNNTPWIQEASDFDQRLILASCLSPKMRDELVRELVGN